jgi:hypothetical protein
METADCRPFFVKCLWTRAAEWKSLQGVKTPFGFELILAQECDGS